MNEDTPVLPIENLDPSSLKEMDLTLISLQNASAKERKALMTALEQQGNEIVFSQMVYTIIDTEGKSHRLSKKKCLRCGQEQLLSEFFGSKNIQPWCFQCRKADPKGAKLERDRLLQRHYPIEKRRAKERKQEEKHPLWRERSLTQLQQQANTIAINILQENMEASVLALEEEYTPAQRRKILYAIQQIIQHVEQLPAQQEQIQELTTTLRTQAQILLKQADALEKDKK